MRTFLLAAWPNGMETEVLMLFEMLLGIGELGEMGMITACQLVVEGLHLEKVRKAEQRLGIGLLHERVVLVEKKPECFDQVVKRVETLFLVMLDLGSEGPMSSTESSPKGALSTRKFNLSLPSTAAWVSQNCKQSNLQGFIMQGLGQAVRSCQEALALAVLRHSSVRNTAEIRKVSRCGCVTSSLPNQVKESEDKVEADPSTMQHKGLENMTVADVLMTKGEEKVGSWLWCRSDDRVYDAVKQMALNNIGSLVVLKPGDQDLIQGIITERDYLRKVVVQDRSSKYTRVAEIMTDQDISLCLISCPSLTFELQQNKLITVTSDTNILHAMQLMTENQIRHAPVIDGRIVGMISIVDVVRAVVEQQSGEALADDKDTLSRSAVANPLASINPCTLSASCRNPPSISPVITLSNSSGLNSSFLASTTPKA
ncbi:hypothetical protein RJ639_014293 [Escallonia herrerae]|uniref:CBS domain-containing protein n=1 Tax=Escallonia herrerae TaxID=1293975 RepID=A0AA88VJ48_9ASTE|nr:hypothetical protein RJ639_014293 [Escallonia herrerae]